MKAASSQACLALTALALATLCTSACSHDEALCAVHGEYSFDLDATLRALEDASGPVTEDAKDRIASLAVILGPRLALQADGTFSWDNDPRVSRRIGWTGGRGSYDIRGRDKLVLTYAWVSEGAEPGRATVFGTCHVHSIEGPLIKWYFGEGCREFVMLRKR